MDLITLRQTCFKSLLRLPTINEEREFLENTTNNPSPYKANCQLALLIKNYQGIVVDLPKTILDIPIKDAAEFMNLIMELHSECLFKNPHESDMLMFYAKYRMYGKKRAIAFLKEWVTNQNEYLFIQGKVQEFLDSMTENTFQLKKDPQEAKISIRYYGPIGTSGYARVARDIARSMYLIEEIDIRFVPMSLHAAGEWSDEDKELAAFSFPRDDYSTKHTDIVFIHAVPDMFIPIVRQERRRNPKAVIVAITVWETNHVPPQWIPHLRWVDRVCFPNRWNTTVFKQDIQELDTSFVPHPVLLPRAQAHAKIHKIPDSLESLKDYQRQGAYIFYTVNEFSGRKGIDISIEAYFNAFTSKDNVVFFIKTHGSVPEECAKSFVEELSKDRDVPTLIMDYHRWTDDEIHKLHEMSDCFVTLTRSEGHGLGACTAALLGKRVIMTRYGGQMDYLIDIDWVPCKRMTPATFCSKVDPRHDQCASLSRCKFFPFFFPAQQSWALPDVDVASRLMQNAAQQSLIGSQLCMQYVSDKFNMDAIGKVFYQYATESASKTPRLEAPTILKDPYDLSKDMFVPQSQLDIDEPPAKGKLVRPTVLIVGCSGFGNLGDDLYARLWRESLEKLYNVYICNTQTYMTVGGSMKFMPPTTTIPDDALIPDVIVVGGGGLLNSSEAKSSIFRVYQGMCEKFGIPLLFLSVGFAFDQFEKKMPTMSESTLKLWSPLLNYASIISVRSIQDRDVLLSLIPRERHFRVKVYSDLCFGAVTLRPPNAAKTKPLILFCPTNFMSVRFPDVAQVIQQKVWEHPDAQLVFLPMDGLPGTGEYPSPFVKEESVRFKALFPNAVIYTGRFFSGGFLNLMNYPCPSDSLLLSIDEVLRLFENAQYVITGRYHGLVLAKAFGVPFHIGSANLAKLVAEEESPLDSNTWKLHLRDLTEEVNTIEATHGIRERKPDLKIKPEVDPDNWDENDRNTAVMDIVTQTPPPAWQNTVEYIQGYSNRGLWAKKRSLVASRR